MDVFYTFEDKEVELKHLKMNDIPVLVNLCSCMSYLTRSADPYEMIESPIIKKEWPLLKKMAEANVVYDIYDSTTWDDLDLEPVLDIVHRRIAPHANNQQRTESGVKSIADQSRTGVKEDRRNARNIINFYHKRSHNQAAKALKPDKDRVQCAERNAHYLDHTKALIKCITEARRYFGDKLSDEIIEKFNNRALMEGERQRNLKTASFIGGLENMSFEQTLKAEQPGRVEISVDMGGRVSMSVLTKKNKTIAVIVAELKARGSKVKNLQKKPIKVLKELLRKDELKRRKGEEGVKTMASIKYVHHSCV